MTYGYGGYDRPEEPGQLIKNNIVPSLVLILSTVLLSGVYLSIRDLSQPAPVQATPLEKGEVVMEPSSNELTLGIPEKTYNTLITHFKKTEFISISDTDAATRSHIQIRVHQGEEEGSGFGAHYYISQLKRSFYLAQYSCGVVLQVEDVTNEHGDVEEVNAKKMYTDIKIFPVVSKVYSLNKKCLIH